MTEITHTVRNGYFIFTALIEKYKSLTDVLVLDNSERTLLHTGSASSRYIK